MSNIDLRVDLDRLCNRIKKAGHEDIMSLPFKALAEIERLNKAVGEQTDMVRRWSNRAKAERRKRKFAWETRDADKQKMGETIRQLEADLVVSRAQAVRVAESLVTRTAYEIKMIEIGEQFVALVSKVTPIWSDLHGKQGGE